MIRAALPIDGAGIDINLSADVEAVATAMLHAESRRIPALIAGWGLFASLFVAATIVLRDFIPFLGNGVITIAFMLANLITLIAMSSYLTIWGVRSLCEGCLPVSAPGPAELQGDRPG